MCPILIGATLVDQITKAMALAALTLDDPVRDITGFNLTPDFNDGASLGMLSGAMAGRAWTMIAITGALTVIVASWRCALIFGGIGWD